MSRTTEQWLAYKTADDDSRKRIEDEIISANLGIVFGIIGKYRCGYDNEAESEAMVAMLKAVRHYRPETGFAFSTYAGAAVARAICRLMRERHRKHRPNANKLQLACLAARHDERGENEAKIDDIIANMRHLNARERWVIRRRYLGQRRWTFSEISAVVGLTKQRLQQIQKRAIMKLRAAMMGE